MLRKILIANRGEIAVRIIRTARRLGVRTVAVVSEADRGAPFARMADEVVEIGPGPATESYLRGDKIIAAAKRTGCRGHPSRLRVPGRECRFRRGRGAAGIKFIGPSPDAMRRMGGKAEAKAIAAKAGVPVVPGYAGDSQEPKTLAPRGAAHRLSRDDQGGGGRRRARHAPGRARRGFRCRRSRARSARRKAAFGDARVLLEKVVVRPRHIEVQVFGDAHGNVVHLFERDCSLQRRNQKVIEEAPAPGMSAELRAKITEAAVACAKAVRYEGAGTVEFLVEGGSSGRRRPGTSSR